MAQPFDYSLNLPSGFQSFGQGYQFGASLAQAEAQRMAALQAAEAQLQRQQVLNAFLDNPNPTAQDFLRTAAVLPKDQAEVLRQGFEAVGKERQQNDLRFAGQAMASIQAGRPEMAEALLRERAQAEANAGNADTAKQYEVFAELTKTAPDAALKSIGIVVAQLPGGDKVLEGFGKLGDEQRAANAVAAGTSFEVKSSEDLPGGYTKQIGKFGEVRLVGPDGRMVAPDQASVAIEQIYALDARRSGSKAASIRAAELDQEITRGGTAAGAKEAGQQAMKAGVEAFQKLGPARQAISTIDQAIAAIDKGASTGIIASRLPNVTQASRELELLRNQMGLAVIGATTFGALSEGELKLALDTGGIDTGMPDLKGYLQRKKVAQTKLANELERAARYLTKPGNTINGWIEENITVSDRRGAGLPSQMPTPDQIRAERERRRQAGGR